MHALDQARAINDAIGGTSWETDVAAHLTSGGYFLASEDSVLLWRPVRTGWDEERLINPWDSDPDGDAWYIWMAVGRGALPRFAAMARSGGWPAKPSVAFHRRGNCKWYRLDKILSRIDVQKTEHQRGPEGDEEGQRPVPEEL